MRLAERREILATCLDERMLGRKRCADDLARASIAAFSLGVVARALAHDAEIIERARDIGMRRPERRLLQRKRIAKMSCRGGKISCYRRLLG
jgi:hypothetical protein